MLPAVTILSRGCLIMADSIAIVTTWATLSRRYDFQQENMQKRSLTSVLLWDGECKLLCIHLLERHSQSQYQGLYILCESHVSEDIMNHSSISPDHVASLR